MHWQAEQAAFDARWRSWFGEQRERRGLGIKHPIWDFLFEYYRVNRNRVERWHPPVDIELRGEAISQFAWIQGFVIDDNGGMLDSSRIDEGVRRRLKWIHGLLEATLHRTPRFQCFGLHEWAMVYRDNEVRHGATPLRLPQDEIAELVESRLVCCSHYDAYRFFSPGATPLNTLNPTQDTRYANEQHGCIHYNMDLYKWCYKAFPWISSDCLSDALGLAKDARLLDMRASPYDLAAYGIEPIRIETSDGSSTYQREQRAIAERGKGLAGRMSAELMQLGVSNH
ncbi:MAG: 3-methyladenine DNA glycosylase [Opitutales bacterium]|nr:3-methyladenine DNA glycosylase [Opitutales bacterium]NRA28452.1 3-methyladenine DNA glycosylase [Opitutales bacterium]